MVGGRFGRWREKTCIYIKYCTTNYTFLTVQDIYFILCHFLPVVRPDDLLKPPRGGRLGFTWSTNLTNFPPNKKSTRKNDQNLGKPPKTIQIPLCFLYVSLWFLYHNRSLPWHVGHVIFLELMAEGHNQKKVDHRPMFHLKILGEFGTSPQIAETKRLDWSREVQWLHASGESAP